MPRKLGVNSAQRKAILRNQASNLLWYGRIETTLATAKEVRSYTEKIITLAMNTYEDTVEEKITTKNAKGKDVTKTVIKDGFHIKDGHPTFDKTWTDPVNAQQFAQELIKHTYRDGWALPAMPR